MPSIKDKSTIEAIAREFTSNSRSQANALMSVGYSRFYSERQGKKLFNNVQVIEAIERIDAVSAEEAGVTVETMRIQYDEDRQFAIDCKSPSACVSASVSKARLYGMDKDAGNKESVPPAFSPEEVEELQAMGKRATLAIKNTVKRA